ncbi:FtsX-like permease family protein [Bacillus pacificus]
MKNFLVQQWHIQLPLLAIDSLQYIIQMQSAFFSIVALFAFLTAVLTIGNQVVIRLMQQTRDVAIMKTVGMSSSNLMKSILLEKHDYLPYRLD